MKKLVYGVFFSLLSSAAICQPVSWTLSEIKGQSEIAGYIYHTDAAGTQYGAKTEKLFTSLRFACSTKSSAPPLMIIMWNTMKGSSTQFIHTTVDGNPVLSYDQWTQDENIIYRPLQYPTDTIMQQLKTGSIVRFTWIDNNTVRRTTAFDLRDMKKKLADFNTVCHTQI